MLLINCKVLFLSGSTNCVISFGTSLNQPTGFARTGTKLYVPIVVTLSTHNNTKLLL